MIAADPGRIDALLRERIFSLVSPTVVSLPAREVSLSQAIVIRDPDGHALRIASR
jgi:hypothetical protein